MGIVTERYTEVTLTMTWEEYQILEDLFRAGMYGVAGRGFTGTSGVRELADFLHSVRTKVREQALDQVKHQTAALSASQEV